MNRLIDEKSPYLLQHANNPVNWYPWCEEAFIEAKKRDVPVFISIGYSSCHWCHVMERESFTDESVAEIINANFVAVKVDREERPDVDNIYMQASIAYNGSGGWPLSVFAGHDKLPFFAGTYYPKRSFVNLLERISAIWSSNRNALYGSSRRIKEHLTEPDKPYADTDIDYKEVFNKIASSHDSEFGGFNIAPKFPMPQLLLFLLRYNAVFPDSGADEILRKSLNAMADGGIYDHVGGGFFRYSTDRQWLVPHFEKMLYDNAMLIMVYAEASRALDSRYRSIVKATVEYVVRVMRDAGGGFYTAQDADSEGVEGKYYLFTPDEMCYLFGRDLGESFSKDYDITLKGNFEGKNILNRIGKGFIPNDKRLNEVHCYRSRRIPPFLDDKITTSSNSLMAAALAVGGRLLNNRAYIELAEECIQFIDNNLYIDGRLTARWREGEARHPATLEDYAYLLWAKLELYYAAFNKQYLKSALDTSYEIIRLFSDKEGAMFQTGADVNDLPVRSKTLYDGALPSGNAVVSYSFLRLYDITGRNELLEEAEKIISSVGDRISEYPTGYSGHLLARIYRDCRQSLSLTAGEGLNEMLKATEGYRPLLNISVIDDTLTELIDDFKRLKSVGNRATAYYCDKQGCRPPVTDSTELSRML
jgi:uncharacterized protein YyaL (SSP411 family)